MIRLIWFAVKLAIVVWIAIVLADHPGTVNIVWLGYEIRTKASLLCVLVLVIVAASLLAYRLVRLIRYGPRGIRLRRQVHRQNLGLQRLEQGLAALASGDAAAANKMALAARKLSGPTVLSRWLQAQAAQLAGDDAQAGRLFEQLTKDDRAAPAGYRGLIMAALRAQDWGKASLLIEEFAAKKPKAPWLQVARYELAARQGAWAQAAISLHRAARLKLLDSTAARRQEAALLTAESRAAAAQNNHARALQAVEQALRLQPDWLPARIALVQALQLAGNGRQVVKQVERFWASTPHPELGALYRLQFNMLPPLKRFKRIENLITRAPNHPASLHLLAEAGIEAELWGEARRHLQQLVATTPTRAAYRLLAEIAEKENGDRRTALDCLQQAAKAPVEALWHCRHCGHNPPQWEIQCPQCRTLAAIDWADPYAIPAAPPPAITHKEI